MARRKHHKKSTHRRRRSGMGAVGTGNMTTLLSMVAGAVVGRVITTKLSDKINPKILAVGQVAVGLFLPKMVKNKFVAGMGAGMAVNGGVFALQSFGVISAISGIGADYSLDYVAGTDNLSVIAGDDDYMGVTDQGIFSGSDPLSVLAGDMEDGVDDSDY
jgi:hypothetical protein